MSLHGARAVLTEGKWAGDSPMLRRSWGRGPDRRHRRRHRGGPGHVDPARPGSGRRRRVPLLDSAVRCPDDDRRMFPGLSAAPCGRSPACPSASVRSRSRTARRATANDGANLPGRREKQCRRMSDPGDRFRGRPWMRCGRIAVVRGDTTWWCTPGTAGAASLGSLVPACGADRRSCRSTSCGARPSTRRRCEPVSSRR